MRPTSQAVSPAVSDAAPPHDSAPLVISRARNFAAICALLALLAVFALAFSGAARATPADVISLLFLGIIALIFWLPAPRVLAFCRRADASCFFLTACVFIVYGLARQAGPSDGFALRFSILEDKFVVPYAAFAAFLGAIFSAPLWWKTRNNWTNALLLALGIIAVFAAGSFWFLGRFLVVGETEELDPRPMIVTLLQVAEFASLTLCCAAACALEKTRVLALRILPFLLLLLWARHAFFAAPLPIEADE